MVDLSLLQSVSYIVGALGVCVAAIFYVLNLRISQRNMRQTLETRKLQFVTSIANQLLSVEGERTYAELINMEWKDYDDFEKKYGSDNNLESCAYRLSSWRYFNGLGYMLKNNMVDAEVLYNHGGDGCIWMWAKFESIIRNMRKVYHTGDSWLWGFEYLADEMTRIAKMRDPSYFVPETFYRYVTEK
jgi:hypothetical protein